MIAPIGHREAARRMVIAPDDAVPATVREDVLLLVTELVNNAVRDGGGGPERSLRVDLRLQPRQVRVEVLDPGMTVSPVGAHPRGKPGRWRFLVEQFADRWGVSRAGPGTCVWFEIEFEG
jgi:hypothetical protein